MLRWMAFYNREPWGKEGDNRSMAAGFATLANLLISVAKGTGVKFKKRNLRFDPDDFMTSREKRGPKVAKSLQELETKLHMFAAAVNARFPDPKNPRQRRKAA